MWFSVLLTLNPQFQDVVSYNAAVAAFARDEDSGARLASCI